MKSASVLKLETAFKPEPSDAEMDRRIALSDHRLRFINHARDIEVRSRIVNTSADDTKRPLQAFRNSVISLFQRCNAFSDSYDNRSDIASAVEEVRERVAELLRLDPNLSWPVGLLTNTCDTFQKLIQEKLPTSTPVGTEERIMNPMRWQLLNEVDELSARLMCLGDIGHGGIEQRRPVIKQTGDLRRLISNGMFAPVESSTVISAVEAIKASVARLVNVPSLMTGKAGFMQRGMPSVNEQADKIIRLVGRRVLAS